MFLGVPKSPYSSWVVVAALVVLFMVGRVDVITVVDVVNVVVNFVVVVGINLVWVVLDGVLVANEVVCAVDNDVWFVVMFPINCRLVDRLVEAVVVVVGTYTVVVTVVVGLNVVNIAPEL